MKCPQMKCIYNIMGGCQKCELCNAEPNELNENCDRCYNCAYDEGILRWDNATDKQSEPIKEIELKPMEIMIK